MSTSNLDALSFGLIMMINTNSDKKLILDQLNTYKNELPKSIQLLKIQKTILPEQDYQNMLKLILAPGQGLKDKSKISADKLNDRDINNAIDDVIVTVNFAEKELEGVKFDSQFFKKNWKVILIIIIVLILFVVLGVSFWLLMNKLDKSVKKMNVKLN